VIESVIFSVAFIEVIKDNLVTIAKKDIVKLQYEAGKVEADVKVAAAKIVEDFVYSAAFLDLLADKFVSYLRDKASQVDAKLHIIATSITEDFVRSKEFLSHLKNSAVASVRTKIVKVEGDALEAIIFSAAFIEVVKDHFVSTLKTELVTIRVVATDVKVDIDAAGRKILVDLIYSAAFIDFLAERFVDFVQDSVRAANRRVHAVAHAVAHDFVSSLLFLDFLKDKAVTKGKQELNYFERKVMEQVILSVAFISVLEDHLTILIETSIGDAKDLSDQALRKLANKLLEEFIKSVSFIDYLQETLVASIQRKVNKLRNWSSKEHSWFHSVENKAASMIKE